MNTWIPFLTRKSRRFFGCFDWYESYIRYRPSISIKFQGSDGIWEIRAQQGSNAFRLLGFLDGGRLVVLTNGFRKKSQKTPASEIALATKRKHDYLERNNNG
ncbi:type II toxin-antitoxin system RelE/ParE family toxin [Pelodictyon luteolum]|uniref:Type II toxin-antitoxin system RelE/ParE family toxin n=1 Tax=Chlorobium luteolum (strain DSM 273 / BCRC 81028 / 2530) TaxID=319225 RepID=Q3B1M9_CHLL3|nr:type II toxin-antitoxin system RelE/ParE family toxin [Pelodictyon luteolum]ABB24752.1 hypothetical protein Plut_1910 [Pelodictyon luteolum DSM 273]